MVDVSMQAIIRAWAVVTFATITFNGVRLGGVPLADAALTLGLGATLVTALLTGRVKRDADIGLIVFTAGVLTISLINSRASDSFIGSLAETSQLLLAVTGLTMLTRAAVGAGIDLDRLANWFVFGCGLSALVAVAEQAGFAAYVHLLTPKTGFSFTGRSQGLTTHPNQLGLASVMAIPFAVHAWSEIKGLKQWAAGATVLFCVAGVFASGSRAALLALGVVVLVKCATMVHPAYRLDRRRLGFSVAVGSGAIFVTLVAFPSLLDTAGATLTRLVGDGSTEIANADRAERLDVALAQIADRPFFGTGFLDAAAHSFPVQVLQTTGIAGVAAFLALAYSVWRRIAGSSEGPLVLVVEVALLAWLAAIMFHNGFTQRYFYVPVVFALALPQRETATNSAAPNAALATTGRPS